MNEMLSLEILVFTLRIIRILRDEDVLKASIKETMMKSKCTEVVLKPDHIFFL